MNLTPRELNDSLGFWLDDQENTIKTDWEKTRFQTYILSLPNFGKKEVTYEKFCKQYMPFVWDILPTKKEDPREGLLTSDQWMKIINGPSQVSEIKNTSVLPKNI